MKELLDKIQSVRNSPVKKIIDKRMEEFRAERNNKELFSELCFCILTANYKADGGIKIQKAIGKSFGTLSEKELSKKLKELGHRFPNARSSYICSNQKYCGCLKSTLDKEENPREWLAENIKGLGYKEASHFLRNIGYTKYAIIDFHIVDLLVKHGHIKEPKNLGKKNYLEIENVLKQIGDKAGLNQAELDLYLWYLETGKVLK